MPSDSDFYEIVQHAFLAAFGEITTKSNRSLTHLDSA